MAHFHDDVKRRERIEIRISRILRNQPADPLEFVGLALSGGGIRSATFNLGVLQGLAKYGLLRRIDYLSTVSGGGYIGSWLSAWIRRARFDNVENALAASPPTWLPAPPTVGAHLPYQESQTINFLRDYSNYLTPRLGILGADTWAAITTYLRNVLLNMAILISFLGAVLLVPRFLEKGFLEVAKLESFDKLANWSVFQPPVLLAVLAGVFLLLAIIFISFDIAYYSFSDAVEPFFTGQKWVLLLVALPLFLAAALASSCLLLSPKAYWWQWALWVAVGYLVLRLVGLGVAWLAICLRGNRGLGGWKREIKAGTAVLLGALPAGAVGGLLLRELVTLFQSWMTRGSAVGVAHLASWGTPLVVIVFLLTGALHIGLMGLFFPNEKREWWSRLTGWLLTWTLLWAGLFGLALFAPLGVILLGGWVKTKVAVVSAWVISTLSGLLAGKSPRTAGKGNGHFALEITTKVTPYIFTVGMLALLSYGVHRIVVEPQKAPSQASSPVSRTVRFGASGDLQVQESEKSANGFAVPPDVPRSAYIKAEVEIAYTSKVAQPGNARKTLYWQQAKDVSPSKLALWLFCLVLVTALLTCRVDINEFSMHLLYRNRLVRCYLGASRPEARRPNRFTGFDPEDDLPLASLCNLRPFGPEELPYEGPYPILNAALNLTHGERLGWQERKAESFFFSPGYCGFYFQEEHPTRPPGLISPKLLGDSFQETPRYAYPDEGIYVGTAMGISGAAASPNMGYHTSPPVAFLMTVFNVRLGWWLGNPRRETWQRSGPRIGLLYLLAELFALTDDRSRYVYLSDGGHFENLGLYELVRRGCRYIILCDADADREFAFGDLGNAIRKCRTDFGVDIDLHANDICPIGKRKYSRSHGAVGTIYYPDGSRGMLIYVKPSIKEDDPQDVLSYRSKHSDFPHQSTVDQWFDESQFESYRALGRHIMEAALANLGTPAHVVTLATAQVFAAWPLQW
jgi:hypothetical protein